MSQHKNQLRDYLLSVTRDLVTRGVLRQAAGESLVDVVRHEPMTLLREIEGDLVTVGAEFGMSLFEAAKNTFLSFLIGPKR